MGANRSFTAVALPLVHTITLPGMMPKIAAERSLQTIMDDT